MAPPEPVRLVRLDAYRPPDHLIESVALDIHLDARATEIGAQLLVRPNPAGASGAPLVLDRDGVAPARVAVDGRTLGSDEIETTDRAVILRRPPDRPFTLDLFAVVDPGANTALSGLYLSKGIFCTQCEAEGFRRILPFPDRPDVLARYRTRIEARRDDAPVLLGNGNPAASGALPGGRHFAIWDDPWPKPSYLFAVVGGHLGVVRETFVTRSGRPVRLEIYVEDGKEDRCRFAMESLVRAMRWDEETFGREYDLDVFMIVAVPDFNMGAMENKGLNIFNDKYILASPETATDVDFGQIEAIVAHEYFHNWTGNRITCRDWFQLCLKEGLTVYRDQEFTASTRSRAVERIQDVRLLRAEQFAEDAGPLAHPVRPQTYEEISNFYTATVYEKGAELVRMLRLIVGGPAFDAGMRLYFERHDGRAATVEDFLACFADSSGKDLAGFARWYEQAGTPELRVGYAYDAARGTAELSFEQRHGPSPGQPDKKPAPIPIVFGFVGENGDAIGDGLHVLEAEAGRVEVEGVPPGAVPSVLRGFSAPVHLVARRSNAELALLARHDGDLFNRWQAAQTLAMRRLLAACGRAGDEAPPDGSAIADVLAHALGDPALDQAYAAQFITLPTEADVAGELRHDVDPDRVFEARRALRSDVARALAPELRAGCAALRSAEPYRYDARRAGRRALAAAALDLLAGAGDRAAVELACERIEAADNMTERFAALSALAPLDVPERRRALDAFYARHADDPLAIDKWFMLQAAIPGPDALARVRRLTGHPAFSFANPNRMRALIWTFAARNPTGFQRRDGEGFAYVADVVLDLDPRNPQLAARLLTTFRSWRTLEVERREHAERALRRIGERPSLSTDVGDIVRRTLG